MTITPQDVERLYSFYREADRAFSVIAREDIDERDPEVVADHASRYAQARQLRSDAHYAWDRAVALSQQNAH